MGVARADCADEYSKELCKAQGVHAYPTIRVYRQHDSHSHEDYHGDRTVETLQARLQSDAAAVVVVLLLLLLLLLVLVLLLLHQQRKI